MCGIAGWIGQIPQPERHADSLCDALHHRGPDGRGTRLWDRACLAHTRLKIIDLSDAAGQPMSNEDGTVWTVFNGEIYNHVELQRWLESRGHTFRSHCDTEVIPHLYEEDGNELISRLRGMFSLAVFDVRRQSLLLGRDRFGIKPLVYASGWTEKGPFLAFASEINAVRQLPYIDDHIDVQAASDFMALSYIPAPQTFFRGIRSVEPGQQIETTWADNDIRLESKKYHDWTIAPRMGLSLAEASRTAGDLVEHAVASQIESDVPLGSLLSGGIDSSLVSAMAQRAVPGQLQSFNVRFPDGAYDETPAALTVAHHIGSRHTVLDMETHDVSWESVRGLLIQAGQPFGDTSIFGVSAIAKLMRKHVTVALSGDGGDEGFGGYATFSQIRPASYARLLPASLGSAAAGPLSLLSKQGFVSAAAAGAVSNLAGRSDSTVLQYLLSWVRPSEHAALFRDHDILSPHRHFEQQWRLEPEGRVTRLERLSMLATEVWTRLILANDFLPKVDTASMKESLEIRVPMLDEDLFSFGLTLPQSLKLRRGQMKPVLRDFARTVIPEEIASMPKHGFGVPVDILLDQAFKDRLRESLLSKSSGLSQLLSEDGYHPVVEAFCDGVSIPGISRQGLYQRAMMLLALHLSVTGSPGETSGRTPRSIGTLVA